MAQCITLKLHSGECTRLPDGLVVEIEGIVLEEIIADPNNEAMYPAGSGVVVHISLHEGTETISANLSDLSAPYEGRQGIEWKDYRLTLRDVEGTQDPLAVIEILRQG